MSAGGNNLPPTSSASSESSARQVGIARSTPLGRISSSSNLDDFGSSPPDFDTPFRLNFFHRQKSRSTDDFTADEAGDALGNFNIHKILAMEQRMDNSLGIRKGMTHFSKINEEPSALVSKAKEQGKYYIFLAYI